ncbi:MAG: hypothetical protein OXT09_27675 [Myxococcales bacterium]|nr:hypothetical protein [Myxococcales bacterium]
MRGFAAYRIGWTVPAALFVVACGGRMPEHEPEGAMMATSSGAERPREPEGSLEDYERRIAELQQELEARLGTDATEDVYATSRVEEEMASEADYAAEPAPPPKRKEPSRCEAAADLRDRICDLSGRICSLSDDNPDDAQIRAKCDAASEACEDARRDVSQACRL